MLARGDHGVEIVRDPLDPDNVRSELRFWRYEPPTGRWALEQSWGEGFASISASGVQSDRTDDIWVTSSSYGSRPPRAGARVADEAGAAQGAPDDADASELAVHQYEALLDGTKVPYFLVANKKLKRDGSTPTLLYGYPVARDLVVGEAQGCMLTSRASPTDRRYGGQISLTPSYVATVGVGWLEGLRVRPSQHPWRRRVWALMAPGAQGEAQGVRGLRGGRQGPVARHYLARSARLPGRLEWRAARREYACEVAELWGAIVRGAAPRHEAIQCRPPARAGWVSGRRAKGRPTPRAIAQTAKPEPETRRQRLLRAQTHGEQFVVS